MSMMQKINKSLFSIGFSKVFIVFFAISLLLIDLFYNLDNRIHAKLCVFHKVANYGLIFFDFVLQYYITEGQDAQKI